MQQDLLRNISTLESENEDIQDKLQARLQGKTEETEALQKEIVKHEQHVVLLENRIGELCGNLEEEKQLHQQFKEREKQLEDQTTEV